MTICDYLMSVTVSYYVTICDYLISATVSYHVTICDYLISVRPKKISVFTVTCQKNLGSIRLAIFFFFFLQSAKPEIVVPGSGISFSKFPVSRHLLKQFYDELHGFSTFFALNFDKKLALE